MHMCAGVSKDTGHWVSLVCSLTIEHGAQIYGLVGCSASCSSNSAVFTPQSAGGPSVLWSCPSCYMVLGSELKSGPQAFMKHSYPFPHPMQDGELAWLYYTDPSPSQQRWIPITPASLRPTALPSLLLEFFRRPAVTSKHHIFMR